MFGERSLIQVFGLKGLPVIGEGDDLGDLICQSANESGPGVKDGDVLVVTHVVVSRAEGSVVNLDEVVVSESAAALAERFGKDPALVEVVLRESRNVVRMRDGVIITETKHGFVCANSGVDRSNVPGERNVALLPVDPDGSARKIRKRIMELTGKDVAVIVSDTHGRPKREGEINVAVGVAGLDPIRDRRGEKDLFDYVLEVKRTAIADELASAAELVIGQADEGVPVALIRGYNYPRSETGSAGQLVRSREKDLFP
ncbi:MAG: coenzyme F420-0:L-glutamate ligase [Candidatus Bathyarchaeota archaeon]|jgi:coenzyme F420-0:L-glutamate ligase/coenzyme F420-1:gamma-L-glutamate ligase